MVRFNRGLRSGILVVAGLVCLAGPHTPLWAQVAKPNPAAAKSSRTSAEANKKLGETVTAKYASATGEIKKAADGLAAALQAAVAAQSKAADAYDAGVSSDVTSAAAEASKSVTAVSVARELLQALESIALYDATTGVEAMKKSTPEAAHQQLEALLTARKGTAAKFRKLADALSQNPADAAVDSLRDDSLAAVIETQLANRVWTSARDLAQRTAAATKANNTDLLAKIDELKKQDAEIFTLIQQQNELQIKLRKLERQRLATVAAAAQAAKQPKK